MAEYEKKWKVSAFGTINHYRNFKINLQKTFFLEKLIDNLL